VRDDAEKYCKKRTETSLFLWATRGKSGGADWRASH